MASSIKRRFAPQRTLLILTNTGSISDRLIDAVEREFPGVIVEQVEHVSAACGSFAHPVALILVDIGLMKEAEEAAARLQRMHPNALTAVIQPNDTVLAAPLSDIVASPLFRGVLPMDFRLDIWLSIVRLMLCGGEYFPPGPADRARTAGNFSTLSLHHHHRDDRPVHHREHGIRQLTSRESEILEMVARGLQNKLIAMECGLSEHTVKVHLHNIIRKLGVHNRTEAAARFRSVTAPAGLS